MKKLISAVFLMAVLVSIGNAQITIVSPNGGERLPKNGQIYFWWTNSVPLRVAEFLDRYDNKGVYIDTFRINDKGYYWAGLDYAYNLYDIITTNLPTVNSKYKLRVIGQDNSGQTYGDESDDFFFITPDATMSCAAADTDAWLTGNTKAFTIAWDGFAIGDPYVVYLLDQKDSVGESFGFILSTGIIGSVDGSMTFDAPFPTAGMSIDPQHPSIPMDGTYVGMFLNLNNFLRVESPPVSLVVNDAYGEIPILKRFKTPHRTMHKGIPQKNIQKR